MSGVLDEHTQNGVAGRSQPRTLRSRLRLARKVFRVHYTQPATALWRTFESEVVLRNLRGSGRGLDLGCGDGTLASVLFSRCRGVRWTGLDIDPVDAALAAKRGIYDSVIVAPAQAIPARAGAFDIVFSNSALEHMPSLDEVLGEIARVLKPNGRLVFTVPDTAFPAMLGGSRLLEWAGRS